MTLIEQIEENSLHLPGDIVQSTVVAAKARRALPLSQEKEAGVFLLYCSGDSIDVISLKTQIPQDILVVTAYHHRWLDKIKGLGVNSPDELALNSSKVLLRQIVIATQVAMQKQLTDVILGRAEPSSCPLIPRDLKDLEKLSQMLERTYKSDQGPAPAQQPVVINNPTNVQVVNQPAPQQVEGGDRITRLRKLAKTEEE